MMMDSLCQKSLSRMSKIALVSLVWQRQLLLWWLLCVYQNCWRPVKVWTPYCPSPLLLMIAPMRTTLSHQSQHHPLPAAPRPRVGAKGRGSPCQMLEDPRRDDRLSLTPPSSLTKKLILLFQTGQISLSPTSWRLWTMQRARGWSGGEAKLVS